MTQCELWQEVFEERAAIAEYDGQLSRREAERLALTCVFPGMLGYVIARCGEVGKRYRPGATATYHAVPYSQEWHNTAESLTAWDQLPLDHPIPVTGDEAFPFHTALCGVQLRQDRRARWVAGPQVTCQRCAVMLSQKDSHDV